MEATVSYTVNIPEADAGLLKSVAKKFGWSASKAREKATKKPSPQLLQAIKEAEEGPWFVAENVEDLIRQLKE